MSISSQSAREESRSLAGSPPLLTKRPYRSKKIQPCDLCRARKVACTMEIGAASCSLCSRKALSCTFQSHPKAKSRPDNRPTTRTPQEPDHVALKIRFLARTGVASSEPTPTHLWFNQTMNMKGHTCFYAGVSGDQGPDLLRHLNFNERDIFGNSSWSAWRVYPHVHDPVYFTIFPESNLDPHCDMYHNSKIEQMLGPFVPGLVDLYYTYVHPSYPLLEPKEELLGRIEGGQVRSSLLSCVYHLAIHFWTKSTELRQQAIPHHLDFWNDIFVALTIETRTPNLDTIRGLLLYMQLPSRFVKEPNKPGQWPLSCLLAGVAQDLGLHIDPSDWRIPPAERKARRILWWAVHAHITWTAHFLGRPSNLSSMSSDVKPLVVDDFTDESLMIHLGHLASARVFIAFSNLSCILEDVLRRLCTTTSTEHEHRLSSSTAAQEIWERMFDFKEKMDALIVDLPESGSVLSLRIAYHTVELSIWRAELREAHRPSGETSQLMVQTIREMLQILVRLQRSAEEGFWLSCR
ncbi:hypothetical protein, variant [Exophiala oligosperma]|uniref:Zn(2)-C6 fungal-type domain-containing protein n=1 Tax=Exophiala oligosperma TaxID=215243 RepID=A0A0D2B0U9_9EURO|nr:hypothetical protein, variant [Exophiala oligosperma]KIW45751.1 hypothetical protein, variant [Exophiala oligosperma]